MSTHAPGARTFVAYAATGGIAILAMVALNLAAARLPFKGLHTLRNYATRANG